MNISYDCYDAPSSTNRVVIGDFDNDGKKDDIAAMYHYIGNNSAIHVWESNGIELEWQGSSGWWLSSDGFNASKVVAFCSGDFDNDGFEDDLAALYYYGNNNVKLFIWTSNGSEFISQGAKWSSSQYNGDKVQGEMDGEKLSTAVSGDFDKDGFNDDIVLLYEYSGTHCRFHMLRQYSNGNFGIRTMRIFNDYRADRVQGRIVSGDFNNDGFKSEIAMFYDYDGDHTRAHMFSSNGYSISSLGSWWTSYSYDGRKIAGRVTSGDIDGDGFEDDVTCFYNYGGDHTRAHVFKSNGTSLPYVGTYFTSYNYNASKLTGRVFTADLSHDGLSDVGAIYDHENLEARIHVWESNGNGYEWPESAGWWNCGVLKIGIIESNNDMLSASISPKIKVYPNPTRGEVNIESEDVPLSSIKIFNTNNQLVKVILCNPGTLIHRLNISNLPSGLYLIQILDNKGYLSNIRTVLK